MINETQNTKAEKLSVPQLRFNEFTVPIKEIRFGKVVESNIYGPRFNANDYSENGNVKTIRGTDLGLDGEIKYEQVPLALLDEKMVNTHKLQDGDIVMITTAECGATGVFRKQNIDYLSSAYGVRIRLNQFGYPFYYKYFFQTWSAKKEINSYIRKATVANLPGSDILRIKVFNPTLPEQQKIACFLSSVDNKLQQLTHKKELLEQYKKGVMQQLFSQQLRFKQPDGSDYPDWEEKKLKDVLYEHKTKNKDGSLTEVFSVAKEKGVVNQIKHLGRSYAAESTLHYKVAFPGDIIYTKSPTKDFPFGIIKQNLTGRSGLVSPLYVVTKPETDSLGFMFHCYFLSWVNVYNYLVPLVQKGAKNTMNINNDDFLNGAKFMLPVSEEEQQKIADYLSGLDSKIESVAKQITQTQQFKKGLLQQMFV